MSRKLDWAGAYNRPRTLGPIMTPTSREEHSTSAKHDKELKMLRADNAKLKREYDELNAILKQLTQEASHEKFDERRVNLLKLQIIQLEKQVCILNEALGGRHEAILDVENTLTWLADKLRSFIAADIKGPMVPIARADLMTLVESSESARLKLFKAIESSEKERIGKDLLFLNPFLGGKHRSDEPVTLLDISLQKMNYLNLRHVAQLESKLCALYKDLIRVFEQIEWVARDPVYIKQDKSPESSRLKTTILKACITLRDAADDLLSLSLLCPSSPWPALKRPVTKQVPVERVKQALPTGLPCQKQEEIQHVLESSISVCNHRYLLQEQEKAVLKEELNFYRATHELQTQYTKSLFEAVRKGYEEFEHSTREVVVEPIKNLLDAYRDLKDSASEQSFKDFLVVIKDNEVQLCHVEEMFDKPDLEKEQTGASAFSKFGSEFFSKLEDLVQQCHKQRNQAIMSRKDVSEEQTKKDTELQQLIEDLEVKYGKQWCPVKRYKNTEDKGAGNKTADSETNESTLDSFCSNTKSAKDQNIDPFVACSDNTRFDSTKNRTCSTPALSQASNVYSVENAKSSKPTTRKDTNPSKHKRWRPKQEWNSDFSISSENNVPAPFEKTPEVGIAQKEQDDNSAENSLFRSPTLDSLQSSNHTRASSCNRNETPTVETTTKTGPTKTKKSSYTYEPRLETVQKTLTPRRAGSLSGVNHLSDQSECKNKKKLENKVNSATPKMKFQSGKSLSDTGNTRKPDL